MIKNIADAIPTATMLPPVIPSLRKIANIGVVKPNAESISMSDIISSQITLFILTISKEKDYLNLVRNLPKEVMEKYNYILLLYFSNVLEIQQYLKNN